MLADRLVPLPDDISDEQAAASLLKGMTVEYLKKANGPMHATATPDVPLVENVLNNYARNLSVDLRVPELPLQLQVEKVQPTPDGLVVTAGAKDVTLNAGGI